MSEIKNNLLVQVSKEHMGAVFGGEAAPCIAKNPIPQGYTFSGLEYNPRYDCYELLYLSGTAGEGYAAEPYVVEYKRLSKYEAWV